MSPTPLHTTVHLRLRRTTTTIRQLAAAVAREPKHLGRTSTIVLLPRCTHGTHDFALRQLVTSLLRRIRSQRHRLVNHECFTLWNSDPFLIGAKRRPPDFQPTEILP